MRSREWLQLRLAHLLAQVAGREKQGLLQVHECETPAELGLITRSALSFEPDVQVHAGVLLRQANA